MTEEQLQELKRRLVVGRKADGRGVYDEQAKAELVEMCLQPGASVSRLARECGVNANQVCRWLRERGHVRRPRTAATRAVCAVTVPSPFMAVSVARPPEPTTDSGRSAMDLHARLPNGVAVDMRGVDASQVGQVIEALGRLQCFGSTKG
jgi:transposase